MILTMAISLLLKFYKQVDKNLPCYLPGTRKPSSALLESTVKMEPARGRPFSPSRRNLRWAVAVPFAAFALSLCALIQVASSLNYEVTYDTIEAWQVNPDFLDQETSFAKIRRPNRTAKPGLWVVFNTTKTLPQSCEIIIQLFEARGTEYRPSFINFKKFFCDYLTMGMDSKMKLSVDMGWPKSCPVNPGKYGVENFNARPQDMAPMLPPGTPTHWKCRFALKDKRAGVIVLFDIVLHIANKISRG